MLQLVVIGYIGYEIYRLYQLPDALLYVVAQSVEPPVSDDDIM
jgi:hypothetical protein